MGTSQLQYGIVLAGLALALMFLAGTNATAQEKNSRGEVKPSGDTIVYHAPGKNRVHVVGCRRLTKDPAELAKMTKMTLAEAEAKGWPLCSRCPGSTTEGRGNPNLPESWVKKARLKSSSTSLFPIHWHRWFPSGRMASWCTVPIPSKAIG
jgi:hypothetical protein